MPDRPILVIEAILAGQRPIEPCALSYLRNVAVPATALSGYLAYNPARHIRPVLNLRWSYELQPPSATPSYLRLLTVGQWLARHLRISAACLMATAQ